MYAAARVFTGWNLRNATTGGNADPSTYYEFVFNPGQHDPTAKTFTFPIYGDGNRTIPARSPTACRTGSISSPHLHSIRRRRGVWRASCGISSSASSKHRIPRLLKVSPLSLRSGTEMKPVVRHILQSEWFSNPDRWFARYSWPVEFVVRAVREIGWYFGRWCANAAHQHGSNVVRAAGCERMGARAGWFSTGAMLARMNFAATLAANQRFNVSRATTLYRATPEALLDFFLFDRLSPAPFDRQPYNDLLSYLSGRSVDGNGNAGQYEDGGACQADRAQRNINSFEQMITRREFIRDGVAAFTVGFAAPRS